MVGPYPDSEWLTQALLSNSLSGIPPSVRLRIYKQVIGSSMRFCSAGHVSRSPFTALAFACPCMATRPKMRHVQPYSCFVQKGSRSNAKHAIFHQGRTAVQAAPARKLNIAMLVAICYATLCYNMVPEWLQSTAAISVWWHC